jgi:hypothetical protein
VSFVTLDGKANTTDTISAAEVQDLLDNITWLRTPASFRLYDTDGGETVTTSLAVMNWANAHYEWREGGGGVPDVGYNTGTGGDYIAVDVTDNGIWVTGAMIGMRRYINASDGAVSSGNFWRRVLVQIGSGTTAATHISGETHQDVITVARRAGFHVTGWVSCTGTQDDVICQAQSGHGPIDVPSGFQPDRRWGLRISDNSTTVSTDYAAARPTSSTQVVDWWQNMRANQFRLNWKPTAAMYPTGSNQAISAATTTLVIMGGTEWEIDPDIYSTSTMVAQQAGWYLVSGQVRLSEFDDAAADSFATVSIHKNAVNTGFAASYPEAIGGTVQTFPVHGMLYLDAGDYVSLYITTGIASTVVANRSTWMAMTLVSSDDGVSSGRQLFGPIPELPTFDDYSATYLPLGVMKVISDITDRLWHQPLVWQRLSSPTVVGENWTDVECGVLDTDYMDLRGLGYEPVSGGGFSVPWAGTWLAVARMQFSAESEAGANIGGQGWRGMRLALDGKEAVGSIVCDAMQSDSHTWARCIVEPFVINEGQEGAVIGVQAAAGGTTDDEAAVVDQCELWVVQVGDGVTRDPN